MGKATTFIIKGRKRALKKAYDRSLNAKHSYYCITGDELVKSYKPFIPLLQDQVFSRGGTSYIITNIEKETLIAVKDLTQAGAEIRHRDISVLRRSVIYDDGVAYFSITEPVITKSATENVDPKNNFCQIGKMQFPLYRRLEKLKKGSCPLRQKYWRMKMK